MIIDIPIDIEDEVRKALAPYLTTYCRPLPKSFTLPCILVSKAGGSDTDTIDSFRVVIDSRAKTEAEADEKLRIALGILKETAALQTSALRHITVNSSGSWGVDPVRPDISMCSATLEVIAHQTTMEV
jgi:hypothetical protein